MSLATGRSMVRSHKDEELAAFLDALKTKMENLSNPLSIISMKEKESHSHIVLIILKVSRSLFHFVLMTMIKTKESQSPSASITFMLALETY